MLTEHKRPTASSQHCKTPFRLTVAAEETQRTRWVSSSEDHEWSFHSYSADPPPSDSTCLWMMSALSLRANSQVSVYRWLQSYRKQVRCFKSTVTLWFLTHDAVCSVGRGSARSGAVVVGPAPAPCPSVEAGHGRKAGVDICRRVRRVALQRDGREKNETLIWKLLRNRKDYIRIK